MADNNQKVKEPNFEVEIAVDVVNFFENKLDKGQKDGDATMNIASGRGNIEYQTYIESNVGTFETKIENNKVVRHLDNGKEIEVSRERIEKQQKRNEAREER